MTFRIIVCAKQVVDPDTPTSAFSIDSTGTNVMPAQGIPPVVNGFCENAVELALLLKDAMDNVSITIISVGTEFEMDVMKKPLSMGADELILINVENHETIDSFSTAKILSKTIAKIAEYDLILCGAQASDWDNAHVPLGIAEMLDLACLTEVRSLSVDNGTATAHSSIPDGYNILESNLPALATVNSEVGEPRYPTLRGIMQASRKTPMIWDLKKIELSTDDLKPKLRLSDLFIPETNQTCEIIEGETEEDTGRLLALKLRDDKII